MRDHQYAVLMLDAIDDNHSMEADIPAVVQILQDRLGTVLDKWDKVRLYYDWESEELEVN